MDSVAPNLAFNSLNDDDLFDLFRTAPNNVNIDPSNGNFDDIITESIDSSSEVLSFDFDDYDPNQSLTKYVTNNQFINLISNFEQDTFSLLHLNIRSLNKHFDDLQLLLDNPSQTLPSIIGLTETWLSSDPNPPFALDNYDFIFNSRHDRAGGGVALYLSKDYNYNICNDITFMNNALESLFIEIIVPNHKNIIVGVVYRPPNSNSHDFLSQLTDITRNHIFLNKDCFIMGDFNINLLKHDSNNTSQEFLELLLSASFLPLVSKPTRVVNNSATLIDNIFSNVIPHPDSYVVLSDVTDHYPIFSHYKISHSVKNGGPCPSRRRITPESLARLGVSLEQVDWSNIQNDNDVNISYDNFLNIVNEKIDNIIPVVRNKRNNYKTNPKLPWVSKSLLRSINRKNKLYYIYKLELTDRAKFKYTSYKNTLTTILRVEKRKYFVSRLELHKHDMQNTWKILKEAMNLVKNRNDITQIKHNGVIIEDVASIANIFNLYFSSIGETLSRDIEQSNKHFTNFLGPANPNSIFFVPTHKNEILDIVSNLKNKKSTGADGVSNVILKSILPFIVDALVHIFNLSLSNGQVPEVMKMAKVIPLFKKGDKLEPNNYRPISLLSSLSKILEKIIHKRTIAFLKNNNILSNSQFGFREKHSTSHALLSFVEKVANALDSSSHMVGIFLDYSKAFDTINHNILLYKLSHYGIRGKALEWFRSYLSNRKQYVFLNGHSSDLQHITCGVPQGSLLGPLLFILYINDFCKSSDILSFILFADDTNLFLSHQDPDHLVTTVNIELDKLTQWIRANRLSLNLQKTKYMLFSNSLVSLPGNIIFGDSPLDKVSDIKFLGVTIDDKFSWRLHIENISKTISRNIGIINRLKMHLPSKSLFTLYSSLILPYLNYGLLAWGNASQVLIDKLLLLQKRVLRIICHTNFLAHTDPLFFDNKILKIKDLYLLQLGQFMLNFKKEALPEIFRTMFLKNHSFHNYPTRHSDEFHLPLLRTALAQNTFIYDGPKFWNSLCENIRNAPSLYSFKKRLKSHLLKAYEVS